MGDVTDQLEIPYPVGTDDAAGPAAFQALAEKVEELLLDGTDAGLPEAGDFKVSSRDASHGRWLLCDGTEKSQAEIEAALGLDAGQAAALVALWGTGASSWYGSAAVGKIQLPDGRGRSVMIAGDSGDAGITTRARGATGGAETHTLTANESGVKSHSHTATVSAHTHSDGTLATDTEAAHTHSPGTLATDTAATHTHGPGTLATDTEAAHTHADGTLATDTEPDHAHSIGHNDNDSTPNSGTFSRVVSIGPDGTGSTIDQTDADGAHSHDVTGATASGGSHSHAVNAGVTAAGGGHSHAVNAGATASGGGHDHDVTGATGSTTPTATVNAHAGESAGAAHENMSPFIALGSLFVRV